MTVLNGGRILAASQQMQIETLRLFCDLVEAESFSTAAEKHHITQGAVSQRIAALEKELEAKLLNRPGRITVTPAGQQLLRYAHKILETYDEFRGRLRQVEELVTGELHIASVYSIGLHELPPYLKWFRDHHPDVDVKVNYRRSNKVYADVLEGLADIGLVAYPEKRPDIDAMTFWQDEFVVVCTPDHPLAARESITPDDLNNVSFIAFEPDLPSRKAIDAMFAQFGVVVNQVMELDNVEMVKRAMEIENAVSILPRRTVYAEIEGSRLIQLELDAPGADLARPLGMIYRQGRELTPAMREFVDLLQTKRLF
ncbi:MAG: DNA-binding transcriptional LysR family regulator [Verrucomicrobiales bacterium]